MDDMNYLTDAIADDIECLVREAISGILVCDLKDACVDLACNAADMVTMLLTAVSNLS
jgi:hypothetical protein